MTTKELVRLRIEGNFFQFYDKISNFVPRIHDFVKRQLKIAEDLGQIDKNYYRSKGILNEVYLDVFESITENITEKDLKKLLFEKSVEKIEEKAQLERRFVDYINVDQLLKKELKIMDYRFKDHDDNFILHNEPKTISNLSR